MPEETVTLQIKDVTIEYVINFQSELPGRFAPYEE